MKNPFKNKWARMLFDASNKIQHLPVAWSSYHVLPNDILFNFLGRNLDPNKNEIPQRPLMSSLTLPETIFMFLILAEAFEHGDLEIS
jgi:hypothetical protein